MLARKNYQAENTAKQSILDCILEGFKHFTLSHMSDSDTLLVRPIDFNGHNGAVSCGERHVDALVSSIDMSDEYFG